MADRIEDVIMNFRALCVLFYIIFYLIITFPERLRLKKLEQTDPKKAYQISQKHVQKAFRRFLKICGVKVEAEGLLNIPEGACLYVGNHSSYFDILVLGSVVPGGTGFVAKDSLAHIPGLSNWMRRIRCLFLDRKDIRKGMKTILQGADYLKEGYSMCIYPEGTRSTTGQLGEFKGGSLKMAQKADVPIVPVAMTGTRDIFENNKGLRISPSNVKVTFGVPFKISELPKEEKKFAAKRTKQLIENMLETQHQIS